MSKRKLVFWLATGFIFLFEGLLPAFTGHSDFAKQGITHLGYPEYFVTLLVVFKVLGALALVIPQVPNRVKEWAYAGFGIELISAFVSHLVVDGFTMQTLLPVVVLAILVVSYLYHDKLHRPFAGKK